MRAVVIAGAVLVAAGLFLVIKGGSYDLPESEGAGCAHLVISVPGHHRTTDQMAHLIRE